MEHRHKSYDDFLNSVMALDFIENEEKADEAIKMVLGILASRLEEDGAHKLTDRLPDPLTYDRLRSHQATPTPLSADQFIEEVKGTLKLDTGQTMSLIIIVWDVTRDTIGGDTMEQIQKSLPQDWARLMAEVV